MNKFYMVWRQDSPEHTSYNTLLLAEKEAKRVAIVYPELPIYVLEALSVFRGIVDVKSDLLTVCVGGKK